MKLFFYYVFHSAKNALKKLLKTWVLVFLLIMVVGGLLAGLLLGGLLSRLDDGKADPPGQETVIPSEETEPGPDDEVPVRDLLELVAGGLILLIFVMNAISADKSGSEIFLPADVNMLFASPMKPQSVLLFRTVTKMGASLLASIYFIGFQVPNLLNAGLGVRAAIAVIFGWGLMLCVAQLLQMLFYVIASSHPGFKKNLRRGIYALLLLIVGGYILFKQKSGLNWWEAALGFFNAPSTRWIPLWGWIKGFVMFAVEGSYVNMLICLGLLIVSGIGLAVLIWRMKADFYEEALKKTDEKTEMLEIANRESGVSFQQRKKDRAERFGEMEFSRGWGANVFFHKALHNRFRFAHLHFFTKTMEFYLAVSLGIAAICRFLVSTKTPLPLVLVLAFCAFYRSLGNSLKEDTGMWFFHMIPEHGFVKLSWSLLGDLTNCLLDVLPGLVIGLILQNAPFLEGLIWLPAIVSVMAYATSVGTFIDLSVNVNAGKLMKQMVQVAFIYFGILPDAALVILFLTLGHPAAAALSVTVVNLIFTGLFLYLGSLVLDSK